MKKANEESMDEKYAYACFIVEKKLGVELHEDYPALKFVEQVQQMEKYYKEQEQQTKNMKGRGRGGTFR